MQTYEILVKNRAVRGNSRDMTLVRTSVGIDVIHVLFDSEEWLGFPVTVTFAQGDDVITQPLILSTVNSAEWVAEAECVIPHEVIDTTGPIRVTFQGTDSDGNHIITAKGSPLSVEESGDVIIGDLPEDVPTVDQWNQAYAKAMEAAGAAQSLVGNLQSRIDAIVSSAEAGIASLMELNPATRESLGVVKIGNGLMVAEDGTVSSTATNGITAEQVLALANLSRLAYLMFDSEFDDDGRLRDNVSIKQDKLTTSPIASYGVPGLVYPDNVTMTVTEDGMLQGDFFRPTFDGTVLTIDTLHGTASADLKGERGPQGEQGEQGIQGVQGIQGEKGDSGEISEVTATVSNTVGTPSVEVTLGGTPSERTIAFSFQNIKGEQGDVGPSGYVLTAEDVEVISTAIAEMYDLAENERF